MSNSDTTGYSSLYTTYGSTKTLLQIRSLLSIVGHGYKLEILGNTFTGNSGTKGIIYIDSYDRNPSINPWPIVIGGNTFTKNGGYIDSNVIYIRARGASTDSVYT
jgi:hypothetical protein